MITEGLWCKAGFHARRRPSSCVGPGDRGVFHATLRTSKIDKQRVYVEIVWPKARF